MLVRSTRLVSIHHARSWSPPSDIYETEAEVVVQVEIAGMRDGQFNVSLHERHLVISGFRQDRRGERRGYHQIEINQGEFRTDVELPAAIDTDTIRAEYQDGFLRVTMRKAAPTRIVARESE